MNESGVSPSRRLPTGLLGMLVLVAAFEQYVARNDHHFGSIPAVQWRNARSMVSKARDCEILCLGTSLTTNGIQPLIIEQELGRKACNLAVFSGQAPSSYYLLKRALNSGARPKVVVLDCQDEHVELANRWKSQIWRNMRLWPEILTLSECLDLSWTARDAEFFATLVVSKALPSARARFEIRANVRAALNGKSASMVLHLAGLLRNWRTNRGAQALPASGVDTEADIPLRQIEYRRKDWTSSPVTETYLRRLLELTTRHGITVFWTLPPIGPRLTTRWEETDRNAFEARLAAQGQSQAPGVRLIDARYSRYPARLFWDGLHLGRPGAVAYSRDVIELLAAHFQDPRTVPKSITLPAYHEREGDDALVKRLEHVYESCRTVADTLVNRRGVIR